MAKLIDEAEFEELYRASAPELFGYLRRRGVPDAEDVVAEIFATAWRRRRDLPQPLLRRVWLFGVARNLMLAQARSAGRSGDVVEQLAARACRGAGAAEGEPTAEEESATTEVVAAALARLAPREREILMLVEWERLTPLEASVALGIRVGTARVRLHRARRALAADPTMRALVSPGPPGEREIGVDDGARGSGFGVGATVGREPISG